MFGYTGITRIKLAIVALVLVILGALTVAIDHAPALLRQFQIQRLQKQAAVAAERRDWKAAILALRQASSLDPNDPGTVHLWVQVLDRTDSAEELGWRVTLSEREPADLDNLLEIARIALPLGQAAVGQRAIDTLKSARDDDPRTLNLVSQYATLRGDRPAAIEAAHAALSLDPSSNELRLTLATLLAQDPDPAKRTEARQLLAQLRSDPDSQIPALRVSRDLECADSRWNEALAESDQILPSADHRFADHVRHLEILSALGDPRLRQCLEEAQQQAISGMEQLPTLVTWYLAQHRALDLVSWLESQPPSLSDRQPIQLALARGLLAAELWQKILDRFELVTWPDAEALRLASISRARRKLRPFSSFDWDVPWRNAVSAALAHPEQARSLARLIADWPEWVAERCDLLWHMFQKFPAQSLSILGELESIYRNTGNTAGLQRVASRLMEQFGQAEAPANNWIYYSLLLESDLEKVSPRAQELFQKRPDDPIISSTYALALYRQHQPAKADAILRQLPQPAIEQPAIAALHAAILTDLGNLDAARDALKRVGNARLLPEENALAEHARRRVLRLNASFQPPNAPPQPTQAPTPPSTGTNPARTTQEQ